MPGQMRPAIRLHWSLRMLLSSCILSCNDSVVFCFSLSNSRGSQADDEVLVIDHFELIISGAVRLYILP